MAFNVNKCYISVHETKNLMEMNGVKLDSVQCVKDVGVVIVSSHKLFWQCKDAVGKANRMLGFINGNFSFKNKDITLPLYIISLARHHLDSAIQFWSHHAKDIANLQVVQR